MSRDNKVQDLIKYWYSHYENDKHKVCLSDERREYTRKDVELLSGKVYSYLKKRDIGREGVVLIDLPKSSRIFIVMLGVLKAGAAFVAVESDLAVERKKYIREESGCKLVVNETLLDQIEEEDYLAGNEETELRDAAFVVYTSGTTGVPKGIVHEYGTYSLLYRSILDPHTGKLRENANTRFMTVAPFNFVATVMVFALFVYSGACVYTPDSKTVKNVKNLIGYMHSNKITQTFLAPSFLRIIGDKLNPEMEIVYTGSEPANNIKINNGKLFNLYLMSETAFVLCQNELSSNVTVAPVGFPNDGIEVFLEKDGEIVCANPYCRGYIKSDNESFKNGYYYTGDIAELDDKGKYIIRGRKAEMIKINGNRVEPLEVESVAEKILQDISCVVKGFETEEKSFLCLYYVAEKDIDTDTLKNELQQYLPYYMIPAHYIKIDTIPRTELGKVNRKALAAPQVTKTRKFKAPETAEEKQLCSVFEQVLNQESISVDDDLFELGLTSLTAIEAVSNLNIEELETADIYKGRTVSSIAGLMKEKELMHLTSAEKEEAGRNMMFPVKSTMHGGMALAQLRFGNKYTGMNISIGYRFGRLIKAEKLRDAINQVTAAGSSFKAVFTYSGDEVVQKYAPELYRPIEIEHMSEEQIEELRQSFVQPFSIIDELPYRIRLIKSSAYTYLFVDFHHSIIDATGMLKFAEDIINAYRGKEISENNYFAYCYDLSMAMKTDYYNYCKQHLPQKYNDPKWSKKPVEGGEEIRKTASEIITDIRIRDLEKHLEHRNITRNILFISAELLALAKFHKSNNVLITWMYKNRSETGNQAGCRTLQLYIGASLNKDMRIKDLYAMVEKEIEEGISTSCYPYASNYEAPQPLTVDDLGNIESSKPLLNLIGKPITLERPYDTFNNMPVEYICMYHSNVKKRLKLKMESDNAVLKDTARERYINDVSSILHKLIDGDESVIQEYVN